MPLIIGPADFNLFGFFPAIIVSFALTVIGISCFLYIISKRSKVLFKAQKDMRFDNILKRIKNIVVIFFGQARQPRYMLAGILHIIIFAGFIILSIRSFSLVIIGFSNDFVMPGFDGVVGKVYDFIKDYTASFVFLACVIAAIRRAVFKPERYKVPSQYGDDHTFEAVFVLLLIIVLMISETLFEASNKVWLAQQGLDSFLPVLSLVWISKKIFISSSYEFLQRLHIFSYFVHDICFFFFLCFLPLGKHFHVVTSVFNVFFMRIDKGRIKPVQYGVLDDKLDDLESFGVKKLEDFTWKHMLDFYSCADCGRCSDQCPANIVKRPLSPRFITIKARDLIFKTYPLLGKNLISKPLVEDIYTKDEIWSCTTCGACEQECPLGIEYIDKIVDLRRGLVDEGMVPQSLQKSLRALEKRGNPYGKMEKKRANWSLSEEFKEKYHIKDISTEKAETLYFVDSVISYDDELCDIARKSSVILKKAGIDFGILGKKENDSGNEVLRFGEEMLFQTLKEKNTQVILDSKAKNIMTSDPHAYNVLKNDYGNILPVKHISQIIAEKISTKVFEFKPCLNPEKIYTYHDPCYLGRHNDIYDDPRAVIDSIKGLQRVEMKKCRDRSFCCGGGGLMLFYEPKEEIRMGVLRVQMAVEVKADIIITACPFCLINIKDAIKVAGKENVIEVLDLTTLIEQHLK